MIFKDENEVLARMQERHLRQLKALEGSAKLLAASSVLLTEEMKQPDEGNRLMCAGFTVNACCIIVKNRANEHLDEHVDLLISRKLVELRTLNLRSINLYFRDSIRLYVEKETE